jgi:hypothetical protein
MSNQVTYTAEEQKSLHSLEDTKRKIENTIVLLQTGLFTGKDSAVIPECTALLQGILQQATNGIAQVKQEAIKRANTPAKEESSEGSNSKSTSKKKAGRKSN